jgi:prepilin-type N-terminal cleavage/methylation domain-containing protein
MRKQAGFTLIEILAVLALTAIMLTLAFPATRTFWLAQSLYGARDDMITEVREIQGRVVSESFPLVYGVRFTDQGSWNATGKWGRIKFDPNGGGPGVARCTQIGTGTFNAGVFNATVSIQSLSFGGSTEQTVCRASLYDSSGAVIPSTGSDVFVFFYARGTATGGSMVLDQPNLGPSKDITLTINSLTGRIS